MRPALQRALLTCQCCAGGAGCAKRASEIQPLSEPVHSPPGLARDGMLDGTLQPVTWSRPCRHPEYLGAVEGELSPGLEPGVEALEGSFRVLQVGDARGAQDVVECARWEFGGLSILPDPGQVQELPAVPLGESLRQDSECWELPIVRRAVCSACTA